MPLSFRDVAVGIILVSVIEGYGILHFAPQLGPTGGLGRLGLRLFLLNFSLAVIYKVFIYPFFISPLRRIPGPTNGNPLWGHGMVARFSKPRGEALRKWMEEVPNDGLLHFRDLFNTDVVVPTSHEMLKTILSDHTYDYEKVPKIVNLLRKIIGDGLILVEGNVHKFQRKHLLPSFQVKVIRDLYPVFWQKACEMTERLEEDAQKPEVEFGEWCTRVTLDIIGIAGFGRDFKSVQNPDDEFAASYNLLLEPDASKALFFVLNFIFPQWLVQAIPFWDVPKFFHKISDSLHSFAANMASERRKELNDPKVSEADKELRNDILSLLVKSNDFTDDELAHQVLTMMAAGHETTSSTLAWCMYLLSKHPEVQKKVREEVRANLPSPSELGTTNINAAEIDALPWLNAVCNETTRLYPTVPLTTRQNIRPTRLGNYILPTGTTIYMSPWAINRSTEFWGKDALEFKPERWINEDGKPNNTGGATSNFSTMTFLHGPRSCIGQGFARSELKCLLAATIGRFDCSLTRSDDTYFPAGLVTTKAANGMWLKLTDVPGW